MELMPRAPIQCLQGVGIQSFEVILVGPSEWFFQTALWSCLSAPSLLLSLAENFLLWPPLQDEGKWWYFGRGGEEKQSKSPQTPGKGERHSRGETEFCLISLDFSTRVMPSSGSQK